MSMRRVLNALEAFRTCRTKAGHYDINLGEGCICLREGKKSSASEAESGLNVYLQ